MLTRIWLLFFYIEEISKNIFVRDIIEINNVINYTKAAGSFAIMIHIFACSWIYIGAIPEQWMTEAEFS